MRISKKNYIKESTKVIGYFSYTDSGHVYCDGDACVISGSSDSMKRYLESGASNGDERYITKKTRFGEIIDGLSQGGAYAFDEEAYARFSRCAKSNGMEVPPVEQEVCLDLSETMYFIRIQMFV